MDVPAQVVRKRVERRRGRTQRRGEWRGGEEERRGEGTTFCSIQALSGFMNLMVPTHTEECNPVPSQLIQMPVTHRNSFTVTPSKNI